MPRRIDKARLGRGLALGALACTRLDGNGVPTGMMPAKNPVRFKGVRAV